MQLVSYEHFPLDYVTAYGAKYLSLYSYYSVKDDEALRLYCNIWFYLALRYTGNSRYAVLITICIANPIGRVKQDLLTTIWRVYY